MSEVKILQSDDIERWDKFVASHVLGRLYHTSLWKKVIEVTFGHNPVYVYIEDDKGMMKAGLPLFWIKSKLFGSRMSSVPCAQACNPLASSHSELDEILGFVMGILKDQKCKYLELKTIEGSSIRSDRFGEPLNRYSTYVLGLDRTMDAIYSSFHKSCIQRPIKKSCKKGLRLSVGKSVRDVKHFYGLYIVMRKRYGLLPLPYKFFLNLWKIMNQEGNIDILHAVYDDRIISSVVLLKYKDVVTYEYGASDSNALRLSPSHFLLWESIKRAKMQNYKTFDFGRTSNDNVGLSEFKNRWGAQRITLPYYYLPQMNGISEMRQRPLMQNMMYYAVNYLPTPVCHLLGKGLYKHLV